MISKKHLYKKAVIAFLILWAGIIVFSYTFLYFNLNRDIRILEGQSHYVNITLPFVYVRAEVVCEDKKDILKINGNPEPEPGPLNETLDLEAVNNGEVTLEFSLLGVLPLRSVTINVLPETKVVPGGQSIGINLHSEGVIVVEHYQLEETGTSPAREAGIEKGDTLVAVEGESVNDVNHTARLLEKHARKGKFSVTVKREGEEREITVNPQYSESEGGYRLGIYIRDNAAGVGTLTFYHPETGRYGALGHIIMDIDTREPVEIKNGKIVNANIVNIKKADPGEPGEKTGLFFEEEGVLGSIDKNTSHGIYGSIHYPDRLERSHVRPLPVGLSSQLEKGTARILTVVEDQSIDSYQVEIKDVSLQSSPGDKGFILKVTDPELLEKTGGIVQGMSGSPVIQDGRLVGAVTHVFVNNPRQGYGVFAEWMVEEADIF